jgi:hypothetical protein
MFSGVKDVSEYQELVQSAMSDVKSMLVSESNSDDVRLNFVCGSLANWKYQQFMASRDRLTYTYAGTVSQKHDGVDQLKDAEKMFYHYLESVSDIIKDKHFFFKGI